MLYTAGIEHHILFINKIIIHKIAVGTLLIISEHFTRLLICEPIKAEQIFNLNFKKRYWSAFVSVILLFTGVV
jgi:hypothetical protein